MTIRDILTKEKGNYIGIVINGIVKMGFTEKSISQVVKSYEINNGFLRISL